MRKCTYCDKLYKDFKNCPLCGKYTISWEPVQGKEDKANTVDMIQKILSFLAHMGD